jgi:hypothetical protein
VNACLGRGIFIFQKQKPFFGFKNGLKCVLFFEKVVQIPKTRNHFPAFKMV